MNSTITTYNFLELLNKYTIQIPIVQRDYAQGRTGQEALRNTFVSALHSFINSQDGDKNLDFIYGYVEEKNAFQPIDGQQRLTTLWLLHVYILIFKMQNNDHKELLRRFSYSTRELSKEFCESLIENKYKLNFEQNFPSKTFRDAMFLPQESDATISAMVNMLDTIHEYFKDINTENIIERLNKITFKLIDMGEFRLGEELYIKMNGRGKPLSAFENFKAWVAHDRYIMLEILPKMDNEWIDFFWTSATNDVVDRNMMHFVNNFAIYCFVASEEIEEQTTAEKIEALLSASPEGQLKKELYMLGSESIFTKDRLSVMCAYIAYYNNSRREVKENDSIYDKLKFIADVLYLSNKDNERNKERLEDWRCITNHLIDNHRPNSRSQETIIRFYKLLKELSQYSCDIMKNLASESIKIESSFAKARVDEERLKASLMYNSNKWTDAINHVQNHEYFNGRIDFILDLSKNDENIDFDLFQRNSSIFCELFSKEVRENKEIFRDFRIALLSQYDYLVYNTNYHFGSSSIELKEKNIWYNIFQNEENTLSIKTFLDKLAVDKMLPLTERLNKIRMENLEKKELWVYNDERNDWWRRVLVYYPEMYQVCDQDRMKVDGQYVFLLPSMRIGTVAYDLFLHGFMHYLQKEDIDIQGGYDGRDPYEEIQIRFGAVINDVNVDFFSNGKTVKIQKEGKITSFEAYYDQDIKKIYKELLSKAREL